HPPWRDTGVEIHGPAARSAAFAFERLWAGMGTATALAADMPEPDTAGGMPVWLIEGEPGRARVYRTLHLTAAVAERRIWITDAYFVAPRPVSEALAAAAQQGVDVRILVPAHNNWPWVRSISRGGYRFLLENGVRVFEWQGPMMHAKTTVADGVWCRVGSSNLNTASLIGNWELDVAVLDRGLAAQLEGLFLADLASSREIVLPRARALAPPHPGAGTAPPPKVSLDPEGPLHRRLGQARGSKGKMGMAGLVRAGTTFGSALAGNRTLGREDRTVLGTVAVGFLGLGALAMFLPMLVGWLFAAVALWFGSVAGIRALAQARRARAEEREDPGSDGDTAESELKT
ncbi:MAG: cardiolipin synthase B, partial [Gemmatimonadetes bacterium]|nr:cardiolipin synthase B [Gemmatimonadota bacterium]